MVRNCFPCKIGNKTRMSVLNTLIPHKSGRVLANAVQQENELKTYTCWKGKELALFADDIIAYVVHSKESTHTHTQKPS